MARLFAPLNSGHELTLFCMGAPRPRAQAGHVPHLVHNNAPLLYTQITLGNYDVVELDESIAQIYL